MSANEAQTGLTNCDPPSPRAGSTHPQTWTLTAIIVYHYLHYSLNFQYDVSQFALFALLCISSCIIWYYYLHYIHYFVSRVALFILFALLVTLSAKPCGIPEDEHYTERRLTPRCFCNRIAGCGATAPLRNRDVVSCPEASWLSPEPSTFWQTSGPYTIQMVVGIGNVPNCFFMRQLQSPSFENHCFGTSQSLSGNSYSTAPATPATQWALCLPGCNAIPRQADTPALHWVLDSTRALAKETP